MTDTISQKSKRQKLLSTGDAQDTVHTNAACSPSQQEMNLYQQTMSTATMLDLGKLLELYDKNLRAKLVQLFFGSQQLQLT